MVDLTCENMSLMLLNYETCDDDLVVWELPCYVYKDYHLCVDISVHKINKGCCQPWDIRACELKMKMNTDWLVQILG